MPDAYLKQLSERIIKDAYREESFYPASMQEHGDLLQQLLSEEEVSGN